MALTALIIDDEQLARAELRYLLERAGGVEILAEGGNGIEGVQLIRTHKPDMVFLDVQMPGLDGFAVIKKLLEKDKKARLPQIVFATAFDQYAVRAFEVNAVDYLLKPFDLARVQKTIEKVRQRANETTESESGNDAKLNALLKMAAEAGRKARRGKDHRARAEPPSAHRPEGRLLRASIEGAAPSRWPHRRWKGHPTAARSRS